MATQVWKCDFCNETGVEENNIITHESKCSYNPLSKKCGTCGFFKSDYGNWDCIIPKKNTYKYYDENLSCPYYEIENRINSLK